MLGFLTEITNGAQVLEFSCFYIVRVMKQTWHSSLCSEIVFSLSVVVTMDGGIGASPEVSASALSSLCVLVATLFCSRRYRSQTAASVGGSPCSALQLRVTRHHDRAARQHDDWPSDEKRNHHSVQCVTVQSIEGLKTPCVPIIWVGRVFEVRFTLRVISTEGSARSTRGFGTGEDGWACPKMGGVRHVSQLDFIWSGSLLSMVVGYKLCTLTTLLYDEEEEKDGAAGVG